MKNQRSFYCSDAQHQMLCDMADRSGMSITSYICDQLFRRAPKFLCCKEAPVFIEKTLSGTDVLSYQVKMSLNLTPEMFEISGIKDLSYYKIMIAEA